MIKNYINVIIPIIKICKNWHVIIFSKLFNLKIKNIELKDGVKFSVDGIIPKADLSMLVETWFNHDYTPLGFEIGEKDLVIDIGANNGFFSIFAAKKATSGHVISFEPVPELVNKIKTNIDLNKISNIKLEQLAVSNKKGHIEFYISKTHNGCHSLFKRSASDDKIIINTIKLEDYCFENKIQKINLLKMDCEGAEYDIFNSLSAKFLKNNIEKISMEYHDIIGEHKHGEIINQLKNNGFSTKVLGDSNSGYIYALNDNLINK